MGDEATIKRLVDELNEVKRENDLLVKLVRAMSDGDLGVATIPTVLSLERNHPGTFDEAAGFRKTLSDDYMGVYHFAEGALRMSLEEVYEPLRELIEYADGEVRRELEAFSESVKQMHIGEYLDPEDYGEAELEGEALERNHEAQLAFASYIGKGDEEAFLDRVREIFGVRE